MVDEIIENISKHYLLKIYQAFEHNPESPKVLEFVIRTLKSLYRHFEPALFGGQLFLVKSFTDDVLFDESAGVALHFDKNILLTKSTGLLVIQAFNDGRLILWEGVDVSGVIKRNDVLTYRYEDNTEFFIAQGEEINITYLPYGSRYATQYFDLAKALNDYRDQKALRTSCDLLAATWADENRIFFQGGGKDLPEKHIQISLYQFLHSNMNLRGTNFVLREFNVVDETAKPVDIFISWNEANRIALIEVKWLGKSKGADGIISTEYSNSRVNAGLKQLKDYLDDGQSNMPVTILYAYLVIFDGRRRNTNDDTVAISAEDGLYYQGAELEIADDRKYFDSLPGFKAPIRMFAAPRCE